jgi:hypothetical protein
VIQKSAFVQYIHFVAYDDGSESAVWSGRSPCVTEDELEGEGNDVRIQDQEESKRIEVQDV